MLKGLVLTAEHLIHGILILYFLCRVEQPSVFTTPLVLTWPHYNALAECITRYNSLCQFFHSRFVHLTLANTFKNLSTI